MSTTKYTKVAQLKSVERLQQRLSELGVSLPCDERVLSAAEGSPMAQSIQLGSKTVGNRWCIHPMEGWDANTDGTPTELTIRRWQRFGESGAKLIWGGEAAAVQPDGRANPNQTLALASNESGLRTLLDTLTKAHKQHFSKTDDLLVGLQLTTPVASVNPMTTSDGNHALLTTTHCSMQNSRSLPMMTPLFGQTMTSNA